jgi:hypothetical protein
MRYFLGLLLLTPIAIGAMRREAKPVDPKTAAIEAKNQEILEAREKAAYLAKDMILKILRDPDSAKFGDVFFGRNGTVCGTVNSKNGFGGYTGAQVFTVDAKYVRLGDSGAVATWNKNCAAR